MQAVRFTLSTGSYRLNTLDAQRLIRGLEAVEDEHPDAIIAAAMIKQNLAGELPSDVDLTPKEAGVMVYALEEMMGAGQLSEELYALRDGLLREPK